MKPLIRIFPFFLAVYHLAFAWVAWQYLLDNGGDAHRYWFIDEDLTNTSWLDFLKPGTDVIKLLTYPMVKYLHLPFEAGFGVFSLLSLPAWLLLWKMLKQEIRHPLLLIAGMLFLLLPNAHFWTSIIGKEPVLFVLMTLLVYEVYRKRYLSMVLILAFTGMALIRPHVAFVLLLSYGLSLVFVVSFSTRQRLLLFFSGLAVSAVLTYVLTTLQEFTGGIPRVLRKYEAHIAHFRKTDAYVPLDQYPLPGKLFTFYFRPLPGEKTGWMYSILSVENIILLIFFLMTVAVVVKSYRLLVREVAFIFPVIFLLLFGTMYVYAYANYGIIFRTRIMITPVLFLLLLTVMREAGSGRFVRSAGSA